MASIPEAYLDLFAKRSFAHLATVMPDGSPQVTPIWVDYDGQHVLVNTARGRIKDRNMRPGVWVALAIMDADNPYRYLQVRGPVVEESEEGAAEHIQRLAHKYTGKPFTLRPGEVRVIYKIRPEKLDLH
ncbi:MAG: PPOX class F420-dependent oxidoreductase [Thermoflexales bacterium]|nr:PPOX class F420-dependent oxidoreductase [Thermoflexales bacterium]